VPAAAAGSSEGNPISTGSARRDRLLMAFRQVVVAILYNQVPTALHPSNAASPRQPFTRVSWTASSASCIEPSIR